MHELLFSRLGSSSGRCKPAISSLLSLHAACRSSGLTGTTKEQKDFEQVAHWVHDARLGNTQQQQQLLSCLDGTTHSLLPVLSETIAAGLKQLFVGDASSFVQQKPTAVHLLGLLCVALAACLEFFWKVCQSFRCGGSCQVDHTGGKLR